MATALKPYWQKASTNWVGDLKLTIKYDYSAFNLFPRSFNVQSPMTMAPSEDTMFTEIEKYRDIDHFHFIMVAEQEIEPPEEEHIVVDDEQERIRERESEILEKYYFAEWISEFSSKFASELNKAAKLGWTKQDLSGQEEIITDEYYTMVYRKGNKPPIMLQEAQPRKRRGMTEYDYRPAKLSNRYEKYQKELRTLEAKMQRAIKKGDPDAREDYMRKLRNKREYVDDIIYGEKAIREASWGKHPGSSIAKNPIIDIVEQLRSGDGHQPSVWLVKRQSDRPIIFKRASARLGWARMGRAGDGNIKSGVFVREFGSGVLSTTRFTVNVYNKTIPGSFLMTFQQSARESYYNIQRTDEHIITPRKQDGMLLFWWKESPLIHNQDGAFMLSKVKNPGIGSYKMFAKSYSNSFSNIIDAAKRVSIAHANNKMNYRVTENEFTHMVNLKGFFQGMDPNWSSSAFYIWQRSLTDKEKDTLSKMYDLKQYREANLLEKEFKKSPAIKAKEFRAKTGSNEEFRKMFKTGFGKLLKFGIDTGRYKPL